MNHTCLCLPSQSWSSFTDPRKMEGWVGLEWLVGYIPKLKLDRIHSLTVSYCESCWLMD